MSVDERAALFYDEFPLRFPYREVEPHGVTEEAYENIRRGYSAIMAGISVGAWYRSGCMPLLFFISIIGIPFFLILQSSEGKMMFRARNAAIFAFRAAANGDPDYMRFLDGDLYKIDTTPQARIFSDPPTESRMVDLYGQSRVEAVVRMIAASGDMIAEWFKHEECANFPHGDRWISFCGTIPAFAFVIVHEVIIRNGPGVATPEQRSFFQAIEDELYRLFKANKPEYHFPLDECLLLDSELWPVCRRFDCFPDIYMSPDAILGLILPHRLATYQKDWSSAFFRAVEGQPNINLSDYAAMRLAADLTGIPTPTSLVGRAAADFGIEKYGSASIVLTQFVTSYMNVFR